MVSFKAILEKFDKKGEKTGWTYIAIPLGVAHELKPNQRTSFRVKGKIDNFEIKQTALLPMGEGDFILPYNATHRKGVGKKEGATVEVWLEIDESELLISEELMNCLADDEKAYEYFTALPRSHQKYYSNWIESAKTIETKTKRITQTVLGCSMGMDYGEMIRYFRNRE